MEIELKMLSYLRMLLVLIVLLSANFQCAKGRDFTNNELMQCTDIVNACEIQSLSMNLFPTGMVAGAVVLVPHTQDINDTAFVVLTFAEEEAFSKEFSSDRVRTIYSLNNNFINPQGVPLRQNTVNKLAIHKDFAGQWATKQDQMFYETVPSGATISVYLSILDLVPCTSTNVEAYTSKTLACVKFELIKP